MSKNNLNKLNIKGNTKIRILNCSNNNIKKLNVINKEKLSGLYCSHNSLKKLKISKSMKKLFALDCSIK